MEIGFSLGSNKGDRLEHLRGAAKALCAFEDSRLSGASPIYDTEPVGVQEAYRHLSFYNAVLVLETKASCEEWLQRLGSIETELGRIRSEDRNAPRTIDIDILYAGDAIIDSGGLQVPHPRWAERRFVVQPLADVRPELVFPGVGKTVQTVLDELKSDESVTRLDTELI